MALITILSKAQVNKIIKESIGSITKEIREIKERLFRLEESQDCIRFETNKYEKGGKTK